jgi:hypothetical protein
MRCAGGRLERGARPRNEAELLALGLQRLEAQRLGDVMVHPGREAHLARERGDRDHRRAVAQAVARTDLARGPVPVDGLGRAVHEDRDVRPLAGHLDRVGDDVGRDAEVLEQPARGELADGVIVDDQDARLPPPLGVANRSDRGDPCVRHHRRGRGRRRRRFGVVHGQETATVERDHIIR